MKTIYLSVFLSIILCLQGCNQEEMKFEEENETITFLQERFPNSGIELKFETTSSFSFVKNGRQITLEKVSEFQDFIPKSAYNSQDMMYKISQDDRIVYLAYSEAPENDKMMLQNTLILDQNFQELDSQSRTTQSAKSSVAETASCTVGDLQSCIFANCADAGAILCGGCLLMVKWCAPALIAGCILEVEFQVERDIYCDGQATDVIGD